MKKLIGNTLRWLVTIGIFYYLFAYKVDVKELWNTVRNANWWWFVIPLVLFAATLACGFIRWHVLLQSQSIPLPFRRVVAIGLVGHFFNSFLLGGTGGDVVKAYYVTREAHTHKPEAVMSILVDRILGLIGLFAITLVMILIHFQTVRTNPHLRWATMVVVLLIGLVFVAIVLTIWKGLWKKFAFLDRLKQRLPMGEQLARAMNSYQNYTSHKRTLFKAFLLSVGLHLGNFVGAIFLGWGLDITIVDWDKYFLLVPLINTIAAIPITVSGFGVREEMYRRTFGDLGVPAEQAVALSLMNFAVQCAWSLVGGVVYLFWKHEPSLARHAREELTGEPEVRP